MTVRQRPQRSLGPNDYRTPVGKRQGLTRVQVEMFAEAQGRKCALCERPLGDDFAVDHDHELAKLHGHGVDRGCPLCFRGLLCRSCNTALGVFREDPRLLHKAASYVVFRRTV